MMYSDDKTWKQHYTDWKHIVAKIENNSPQNLYRIKIFQRLINEYESSRS